MKLIFFIFLGFFFCTSTSSSSASTNSTSTENNINVLQNPAISSDNSSIKELCTNQSTCNATEYKPPSGFYEHWPDRNCLCDQNCAIYGDCCPDSPFYKEHEQKKNYELFQCSNIISENQRINYYMKQSCPSGYTNMTIKSKCENHTIGEISTDVNMMKAVTDTKQNITYANEYCALCNGVADYQTWPLRFSCYEEKTLRPAANDSQITGIVKNVKFNRTTSMYHSAFNGQNFRCKYTFVKPSNLLLPFIRPCYPNVIATCSGTYDQATSNLCESFTTLVHPAVQRVIPQTYRNEYCAKCNGVTKLDPRDCIVPASMMPPGRSFSQLFSNYGKVDPSDICSSGSQEIRKQFC